MSALPELVDDYLDHLRPRARPATVEAYRAVLRQQFLPWAKSAGLKSTDDLTQQKLDAFTADLRARTSKATGRLLSPVTVATYARHVHYWLAWARREGALEEDLAAVAPKPPRRTLQILDREEIEAMEAAARDPRDRLIVRLLADTGLRAGELVNLRCCDLVRDQGRSSVHVRGKSGGRIIPIDNALHRRLRGWIESGRPGPNGDASPIFVAKRRRRGGREYERLLPNGVDQLIRRLAEEAGISKRVYPHLFRHTFATRWLDGGGSETVLRRLLGHGSLAMIDQVYAHLSTRSLHDAMERHLRGS